MESIVSAGHERTFGELEAKLKLGRIRGAFEQIFIPAASSVASRSILLKLRCTGRAKIRAWNNTAQH